MVVSACVRLLVRLSVAGRKGGATEKKRQSFLVDLSGQLACEGKPFRHHFDMILLHF